MTTLFYLSFCFNLLLLTALCFVLFKKKPKAESPTPNGQDNVPQTKPARIINQELHDLSERCKGKLPYNYQQRVKLLVEIDHPEVPAILQIDNLRLSLKREEKAQAMFDVATPIDTLYLARDGYDGTSRYVPVPSEVAEVMSHRNIINIYLKELGLETISDKDEFWCIDTQTGYSTGWKRFNYDISDAFNKLSSKFKVRQKIGRLEFRDTSQPSGETAKLFLLLKGWEYLFTEV